MRNDRGGGSSPKAQAYEAFLAALVNPSSPTPKRSPINPNIKSQAYYLPQPKMLTGEVFMDDCKRTTEPSPVPGISKGVTVEIKSPGATGFLQRKTTRGYSKLRRQLVMQNGAIEREGKRRRLFWCIGRESGTVLLRKNYGETCPNAKSQVGHP